MKKILYILIFVIISKLSVYSQEALVSSAFECNSEFVSMSISVGEAFCSIQNFNDEKKNEIQLGVQQTNFLFLIEKKEVVNEIILYPNPAISTVNLDLVTNSDEIIDYHYVVYGLDGKKCLDGTIHNQISNIIDVSALSVGKYIFTIQELPNQNINFIKID